MTIEHWLETYKSLINISIEGFKFSLLANGGAAVALLAYLGAISSKGATGPDMRWSMAAFLSGLFACGISMFFAYLTQLKLLGEIGRSGNPAVPHGLVLWIAIAFFALSLFAFAVGSWQAVLNFR